MTNFYKIEALQQGSLPPGPSVRCPACRQMGTLESLPSVQITDAYSNQLNMFFVQRRCPNPTCHTHIFCIVQGNQVIETFPPERIDFDTTDIPDAVAKALDQAIACHAAGAYTACAIMVRKTLEELCHDREANGRTLHHRLEKLKTKMILPPQLIPGLDALKFLGNDAAHVEARVYDEIGKREVEAGIAVAKELLKAAYQYDSIVRELEVLQRPRDETQQPK